MGKKLAIKGHSTRGKEVNELLRLIGGKNSDDFTCSCPDKFYFITNEYIWWEYFDPEDEETNDKYTIFTLEEFLKKYPFKVGDKVYTKSNAEGAIIDMVWNGFEVQYHLSSANVNALGYFNRNELKSYKEEVGLKGDKVIDNSIDASQFMRIGKTVAVCFNTENYEKEVELKLGNYEIAVRDGKTYAVLKKPKYPTTYEECCTVLRFHYDHYLTYDDEKDINPTTEEEEFIDLMDAFSRLIVCRNAYWKIAGKEMGLGKPWKPDWNNISDKYCIYVVSGDIWRNECQTRQCKFAFPTVEMRDAFYENFKDLIEQCKELL